MDTRLVLQIILGVLVASVVILGVVMLIAMTRDAETVVVPEVIEEDEREVINPWAGLGDTAISLVRPRTVRSDPGIEGDGDNWTIEQLMEEPKFVEEVLKITSAEPKGWEAQWWDETRFGSSFFRVRYAFEDEAVTVGPTWLVDIHHDHQDVVPKNVLAQVVTDPEAGMESDYYDQERQVVSAIINHRFPGGINLGGALLVYFQQRDKTDDDAVLGWTVNHIYQEMFQAFFQWTDGGENVYAEFEFNYDDQTLRPANLQATEIMAVGEEFDPLDRVDVYPGMYDPDELIERNRWQGPAQGWCRRNPDPCEALGTILADRAMLETLEWTLTEDTGSADLYEECKTPDEDTGEPPACRWEREELEDRLWKISHVYDLGDGEGEIAWQVHLDEERVTPLDPISELAYRAVRPRR